MRNTYASIINPSNSKRKSHRSRLASGTLLQSFHIEAKISLYEQHHSIEKIAFDGIKRQLITLEKYLAVLRSQPIENLKEVPSANIQFSGVNLTIDPSLSSFFDDPFIIEKNRRADLKLSSSPNNLIAF